MKTLRKGKKDYEGRVRGEEINIILKYEEREKVLLVFEITIVQVI